jgi:putative Mg2+ transporter-C (MgtC) family protein
MGDIAGAVGAEFSDLSAVQAAQLAVRLVVAGVIGGFLGWQRGHVGKAAGLRTHVLVAVGSAAFVAVPVQAGMASDGVSRILQGLVTGIGFLGAGCILKRDNEGNVLGLTTAAGLWFTAGVGVAAGMGREVSALILGVVGYFTLSTLTRWDPKPEAPPDANRHIQV